VNGHIAIAAIPTLELRLLGAVECSLFQKRMTADYNPRSNASISSDFNIHFHVARDARLSRQGRVYRLGQLGHDNIVVWGIDVRSALGHRFGFRVTRDNCYKQNANNKLAGVHAR
jgi:hypothetical protein